MSNKAASNVISLPKGGGAVSGMGEKFSPDLFTGTGNFSVPVAVPPGRNGFQPDLSLSYSTGSGNSPFGLGWNLSVPGITRKTNKGIPVYDDEKDVFILSGAEDLVPVHRREETLSSGSASEKFSITTYRPRTEGLFARIEHYKAAASGRNYWKVMSKNGLTSYYGHENKTGDLNAVLADPENRSRIFAWKLTRTVDLFGNEIIYEYERELKEEGSHHFDQLYLAGIKYVDYLSATPVANTKKYLVSVALEYYDRPDHFSTYDSGFEIRTTKRCISIKTFTHPEHEDDLPEFYLPFGKPGEDFVLPVKTLYLNYADEITGENLPLNGSSLLHQVQIEGHGWGRSGQENELMPPLEFRYSGYQPDKQDFFPITGSLPAGSLGNAEYELADLTGDGLPDILQLNGVARYWKNLGNGKFDLPKNMKDAPAGLQLADPDVQLIDANGDGKADLLVNREGLSGYFPLNFKGNWDRNSFRKNAQRPSFSFADPEVKLMDLDGDGITDVLRNGSRFEYFYNHPEQGFYKSQQASKKALEDFPNVSFTDPRVKTGKLCSSLQNIVMVHNGRVDYWPNLGHGRWGKRVTMKNCPRFPYGFNPARILLGDVDGDGLDDLIYVENNKVTLWINKNGNSWSEPIEITGTPAVTDADAIRITDILGTGVSGLLFTRDATATNQKQQYMFLDFCGGVKPYLLQEMDNNMGALTRVQYTSSTKFYTEDAKKKETRWQTPLPFPVLVVHRVEVFDRISGGKMTTEYNYHHGYWDGGEREFRGFGRVDQRDTEAFNRFNADGLHDRESFRPLRKGNSGWSSEEFSEEDFEMDTVSFLALPAPTGDWLGADFKAEDFLTDAEVGQAVMNRVSAVHFAPPTETRTWFHLGPLGDEHGEWYEANFTHEYWQEDQPAFSRPPEMELLLKKLPRRAKRDAFRALRGSVLRTELYAFDGSSRQNRPYTVTESLTGVAEVRTVLESDVVAPEFSFNGSYSNNALDYLTEMRIFFACGLGQRTTQWERGNDPMTQFSFTGNYDQYGQAKEQLSIAVPRGKDFREADSGLTAKYLATASVTEYAYKNEAEFYFTDRVIKTTGYDVSGEAEDEVFTFKNGIETGLKSATVPYELTGQTIHYYDGNDFVGLPYGDLGDKGALMRTEVLMLTPEILDLAYGADSAYAGYKPEALEATPNWGSEYPAEFITAYNDAFSGPAGYNFSGQNPTVSAHEPESYYAQAERKAYNAIGLVLKTADPLHSATNSRLTEITYDAYQLLPVNVKDPLNLETTAQHDYRVLQPRMVTDANGNRTSARFSPLGLVHEQGVLGKVNASEGDMIAEGAYPDFEASTRLEYDFYAFCEQGLPVWVQTTQREHHFAESPGSDATLVKVEYSDGFGRLLQTRAQAEDIIFGATQFGDAGLPVDQNLNQDAIGIAALPDYPNVLVSGWQTYNNKGKVVEKYEPFFDTGFNYKPGMAQGKCVTMHYDPRGQVVRTVNPDGTEQRVIFGIPLQLSTPDTFTPSPWEQYTYDAADLGIGNGTATAAHQFTPKSALLDALGRTVQTVDRLFSVDLLDSNNLPTNNVVMQYEYDIRGNRTKVTDALNRKVFQHYYDLKPKAGEDDPGANVLYTWHIDSGVKTSVFSAAGTVLENRDSKGALVLHAYDQLNRPVRMWARDKTTEDVTLRQRLEYGDSAGLTNPETQNLNGQLYRHFDEAGLLWLEAYDFKGNLLKKNRQVLKDELTIDQINSAINWNVEAHRTDWSSIDPVLDLPYLLNLTEDYITESRYDALNRVTEITCPSDVYGNEKQIVLDYNRAGALEGVKLIDLAAQTEETYVERIAYNAKGQRLLIAYGNGTMTRYAYDADTFRLMRLRTEKYVKTETGNAVTYAPQSGTTKQDLAYAYDLAGNIVSITDRTPGCGIMGTPDGADKLKRSFTYDALYRLQTATGRETGQTGSLTAIWDDSLRPTDSTLAQAYTQSYQYDRLGNIEKLIHAATNSSNSFTREFTYKTGQNLLDNVTVGSTTHGYSYDANGNQTEENQNRKFAWDYADRLRSFCNQAGSAEPSVAAHYLYDAGGQRLKKFTRKQNGSNGIYEVTVYIDGLFEHRYEATYNALADEFTVGDEQTLLHIMDDQKRIASKVSGDLMGQPEQVQYFLDDHLGSSSVVLKQDGSLINREEYYPFGETSFGSFAKKRYRFCGKERDEESGLYYYGARYYVPWICRFVSVDPLVEERDWINSYNYVQNNPLGRIDPSGASDTKYEDEAGNLLLETNDGSDAVVTVKNEKLSEFTENIKSSRVHGMESVYDSKGWNDHWKSELLGFKLSEAQESALHTLNSDWSRKEAIKFWQNPSASTSLKFSFAEALSQWTNPELVVGGLSAGISGRQFANKINLIRNQNLSDDLIAAANVADRQGLTKAANHLKSHYDRNPSGSLFPKLTGNAAAKNAQAEAVLKSILTDPKATTAVRHHAKLGWIMEIKGSGGRGARFSSNGKTFIGWIE